jgi:hypothetical protein
VVNRAQVRPFGETHGVQRCHPTTALRRRQEEKETSNREIISETPGAAGNIQLQWGGSGKGDRRITVRARHAVFSADPDGGANCLWWCTPDSGTSQAECWVRVQYKKLF